MRMTRLHSLRQQVKRGLVPRRMFGPQEPCIELRLPIQLGRKLSPKRDGVKWDCGPSSATHAASRLSNSYSLPIGPLLCNWFLSIRLPIRNCTTGFVSWLSVKACSMNHVFLMPGTLGWLLTAAFDPCHITNMTLQRYCLHTLAE